MINWALTWEYVIGLAVLTACGTAVGTILAVALMLTRRRG